MSQFSYEAIESLFTIQDGRLFRRTLDGRYKPVLAMNGNRLFSTVEGERIYADDIAWMLFYGHWPKYYLINISGDWEDLRVTENIFPCRLTRLRFRCTKNAAGTGYTHPLSDVVFASPATCRQSWNKLAKAHYMKDLVYIEAQEREEQALRANTGKFQPVPKGRALKKVVRAPKVKSERVVRPPRPDAVPGKVWHWFENEWISLPEPCHIADDWRVRAIAVKAGATGFRFNPVSQRVDITMPDGSAYQPAHR